MARQNFATTLRSLNISALMGSACLWAWIGSLYTSTFFVPLGQNGLMPEVATWATFGFVVLYSAVALAHRAPVRFLLSQTASLVINGALGTLGSLLFVLAAHFTSWPLLIAGAALCGLFMTLSVLAWGAVYCAHGTQSASLYVAGGFACAIIPNLLFALMAAPASAVVPAALPLLANLFLLGVPASTRRYTEAPRPQTTPRSHGLHRLGAHLRRSLGISVPAVWALALIMLGLGYMQHQISFTDTLGPTAPAHAIVLPVVRGLAALLIFVVAALRPRRAPLAYRLGLLAIIAGFSLMPFLYGGSHFWIAGAVMTGGYAAFDVLIWVLIAQVAYAGLSDSLGVVCTVRLLVSSLFCVLGGVAGMALGSIATTAPFAFADAILVGYLMTIAVVLVLSSPAVWELFDARPPAPTATPAPNNTAVLHSLADTWGLTEREREVCSLLAVGRTQPWIAEHLGISESTVNSHVRHIYGKANVNSRQGLLDRVLTEQGKSIDE